VAFWHHHDVLLGIVGDTQKLAKKGWRFELFIGYTIGVLLLTLALGLTLEATVACGEDSSRICSRLARERPIGVDRRSDFQLGEYSAGGGNRYRGYVGGISVGIGLALVLACL